MSAAQAGWMVIGVALAAALVLMAAGAIRLLRANRQLKRAVARIEQAQRLTFDPLRLEAAVSRLARGAEGAGELLVRAQRALATIGRAIRFFAIAARVIKALR